MTINNNRFTKGRNFTADHIMDDATDQVLVKPASATVAGKTLLVPAAGFPSTSDSAAATPAFVNAAVAAAVVPVATDVVQGKVALNTGSEGSDTTNATDALTAAGFNSMATDIAGPASNDLQNAVVRAVGIGIDEDAATQEAIATHIVDNLAAKNVDWTGAHTFEDDIKIGSAWVGHGGSDTLSTRLGFGALASNATGINNTSIGAGALTTNTGGSNNTGIGLQALGSNVLGEYNTSVGVKALYDNTQGSRNTAVGVQAATTTETASDITAVGYNALYNTAFNNTSGFGSGAVVTGGDQVQLGDSATTTYVYGTVQNRSDLRDKADVRPTVLGLDFVNKLRPVDYKWDMREDYKPKRPAPLPADATESQKTAYKKEMDAYIEACKVDNLTHDGSKKRNRFHHGLIAQDVQALIAATGVDFGGFQHHKKAGGHDVMSVGYDELIAPLIKAVQELSAKVAALEAAQ